MKLIFTVIFSMLFITSCSNLKSKKCSEHSDESVKQCNNNLSKKRFNKILVSKWSPY